MPNGQCPLCRRVASLQQSHFIPKGIYRTLRDESAEYIAIGPQGSTRSSRQPKAFLLCADCEERFNSNGEGWVLAHGLRPDGEFKLQQAMLAAVPTHEPLSDGGKAFAASSIPMLKIGKLVYFAMSIFWRAAVFDWSDYYESAQIKILSLGPYEETIRRYLIGEEFPEHAHLSIFVSDREDHRAAMAPPFGGRRKDGYYSYELRIPGIFFSLTLGQMQPASMKLICAVLSEENLIFLSPVVDNKMEQYAFKLLDRIRKNGGRIVE